MAEPTGPRCKCQFCTSPSSFLRLIKHGPSSTLKTTISLTPYEPSRVESLPSEILLQIFSHLDPVNSTCFGLASKRFYPIHCELHRSVKLTREAEDGKGRELRKLLDEWKGAWLMWNSVRGKWVCPIFYGVLLKEGREEWEVKGKDMRVGEERMLEESEAIERRVRLREMGRKREAEEKVKRENEVRVLGWLLTVPGTIERNTQKIDTS